MATAIASPAAAILCSSCSSRRQNHTNLSIITVTSSFQVSCSLKLCSSVGSSPQIKNELWTSFSARSSRFLPRFLCSVSCEVDSRRERDAKKQRPEHGMEVESDESTNRHVLDIQNSISSERKKTLRKERNPKHLNGCASSRNRVAYFQVIRYPLITESTMANILRRNTLVFVVHEDADKKSIRNAAKKLFKIEIKKINTSIMPDGTKKAYLVLTPHFSAVDVAKKIKAI